MTLRALDLFCGAGGATRGLQLAGFHVTGVDIRPQSHYIGDAFIEADALDVDPTGYDLVWASPPCQHYSAFRNRHLDRSYPDLVVPVRERLAASGVPYIIENVVGAPLRDPLLLCGTMFGLRTESGELRRHRLFELSWRPLLLTPPCNHQAQPRRCYGGGLFSRGTPPLKVIGVYGHSGGVTSRPGGTPRSAIAERRAVMGVDWMNGDELSQAIPPAYSRYLATAFLATRRSEISA